MKDSEASVPTEHSEDSRTNQTETASSVGAASSVPKSNGNSSGTTKAEVADNGSPPADKVDAREKTDGKEPKKGLTWERTIEIAKLVATVWAALLGSWVTMQYNQRQNELNRIQAIAQMLPHIGSSSTANSTTTTATGATVKITGAIPTDDMARDGAFWAVFRTANDRVMLRDLASLFPLDIYRVVSSIAIAGELDHDRDALVALQVASEKLAAQYSNDPKKAELASRLYAQALKLRERNPDDSTPLHVVDLSSQMSFAEPTGDQLAKLVKSINDLAAMHHREMTGESKHKSDGATESKEMYKRARMLGLSSTDPQVMEEVARADIEIASLYQIENLNDDAFKYLKEALDLQSKITGKPVLSDSMKILDKNGDGFADTTELATSIDQARARMKSIFSEYADKGVALN